MILRGKIHAGHGLLFGTIFGFTLANGHPFLIFTGGLLCGLVLALMWKVGRRALIAVETRLRSAGTDA
jgi:sensor c-di-GMP phosphodiesterase-like protein